MQAILLGLGAFIFSSGTLPLGWMSLNIMSKPLLIAGMIGIIMGDTTTAMIIGCTIQTLYLGATTIGGVSSMPSIGTTMWFALPIAMSSANTATTEGVETAVATALAICMACSGVETALRSLVNGVKVAALHHVDSLIDKGKLKQGLVWSYIWQNGICFVQTFPLVVLLAMLGQEPVLALVSAMPAWVTGIITVWTTLLRLLGFGLLLATLLKVPSQWLLFLFGFALVKGAGWSTMTLTLVAIGIAYIVFVVTGFKNNGAPAATAAGGDDFDDLA
jgi:mannose/fructose/N-acetylgalactosamine-specific phosphotransferase system component IIC